MFYNFCHKIIDDISPPTGNMTNVVECEISTKKSHVLQFLSESYRGRFSQISFLTKIVECESIIAHVESVLAGDPRIFCLRKQDT